MQAVTFDRIEADIAFHKRSISLWENDLQYPAIKEKAQREIEIHQRVIQALSILINESPIHSAA